MKPRILWTGVGFIGRNFVEMFHEDYDIVVFDDYLNYASQAREVESLADCHYVNCADKISVDAGFEFYCRKGKPFDAVVIAHAQSHNNRSIEDPGAFVQSNIVGVHNILEACREWEVPNVVHISTDECIRHYSPKLVEDSEGHPVVHYGGHSKGMIMLDRNKYEPGDMFWEHSRVKEENSIIAPTSPYSSTKAAGELLASSYRQTYKMPVTIVRPTNIYGPHQNTEKLIPMVISKALKNEKIGIYETPAYRDWNYVEDACRAIKTVLDTDPKTRKDLYHISAYNEKATLDIVHGILDYMGKPRELIELIPDRPAYDLHYALDSSRIRSLGWEPKVSLIEGLCRTVDYFNG